MREYIGELPDNEDVIVLEHATVLNISIGYWFDIEEQKVAFWDPDKLEKLKDFNPKNLEKCTIIEKMAIKKIVRMPDIGITDENIEQFVTE